MTHPNLDIINDFFEAYFSKDINALRKVASEDINWYFPGHHHLGGIKKGMEEVVNFFDTMNTLMSQSHAKTETLVTGFNDDFVVESQRIITHRSDGINLDSLWCVLWKFENNKIIEGRHFSADQQKVDRFFHKIFNHKILEGKKT